MEPPRGLPYAPYERLGAWLAAQSGERITLHLCGGRADLGAPAAAQRVDHVHLVAACRAARADRWPGVVRRRVAAGGRGASGRYSHLRAAPPGRGLIGCVSRRHPGARGSAPQWPRGRPRGNPARRGHRPIRCRSGGTSAHGQGGCGAGPRSPCGASSLRRAARRRAGGLPHKQDVCRRWRWRMLISA